MTTSPGGILKTDVVKELYQRIHDRLKRNQHGRYKRHKKERRHFALGPHHNPCGHGRHKHYQRNGRNGYKNSNPHRPEKVDFFNGVKNVLKIKFRREPHRIVDYFRLALKGIDKQKPQRGKSIKGDNGEQDINSYRGNALFEKIISGHVTSPVPVFW
ncbi:MAG: hypothetical protein LBH35_07005 [Treponema sp.]|jgi:hypothetical protein|nr:hypothetical protein [Treponema sp.]